MEVIDTRSREDRIRGTNQEKITGLYRRVNWTSYRFSRIKPVIFSYRWYREFPPLMP